MTRALKYLGMLMIAVVVAGVLPAAAAVNERAAFGVLKVTAKSAQPGSTVTLTTQLKSRVKRPLLVEVKSQKSWKVIARKRSSTKGRLVVAVRLPASGRSATYRVRGIAGRVGSQRLVAGATNSVTITLVALTPVPTPSPTPSATPSPTPAPTPTTNPTPDTQTPGSITLDPLANDEVDQGDALIFSGVTSALGVAVTLEYLNGDGRWLAAGQSMPDSAGRFEIDFAPDPGSWRFRAVSPESPTRTAASSLEVSAVVHGPTLVVVEFVAPDGSDPSVTVQSPSEVSVMDGPRVISRATPGLWSFHADPVEVAGELVWPQVGDQQVDVTRGQSVTVTLRWDVVLEENAAAVPDGVDFAIEADGSGTDVLTFATPTPAQARRLKARQVRGFALASTQADSGFWAVQSCPDVGPVAVGARDADGYRQGVMGRVTSQPTCLASSGMFFVQALVVTRDASVTYDDILRDGSVPAQFEQLALSASDVVAEGDVFRVIDAVEISRRNAGKSKTSAVPEQKKTAPCSTSGVAAEVMASFSIEPKLNIRGEWRLSEGLTSASVEATLNQKAEVALSLEGRATCKAHKDLGTLRFAPFTFPVGPIAVVVTPEVGLSVDASAEAEGTVRLSATETMKVGAKIAWDKASGDVTATQNPLDVKLEKSIDVRAKLTGSLSATADLFLKLNGIGGPKFTATARLKAAADVDAVSGTVAYEVVPSADITGSLAIQVFSFNVQTPTPLPIWDHTWPPLVAGGWPVNLPQILSTPLPSSVGGTPYEARFRTLDNREGRWEATGLPTGIILDGDTGTLSGTPMVIGSFDVTVTFTDGLDRRAARTFTLLVEATTSVLLRDGLVVRNAPHGTAAPAAMNEYVDQLTIDGNAPASGSWNVVGGSLPPGLALAPSGSLTGRPTTRGTFEFAAEHISASDVRTRRIFEIGVTGLDVGPNCDSGIVAALLWDDSTPPASHTNHPHQLKIVAGGRTTFDSVVPAGQGGGWYSSNDIVRGVPYTLTVTLDGFEFSQQFTCG